MKKINSLCLTMVAVVLMSLGYFSTAKAQAPASHVFHINTQYMRPGMDSLARAESSAMLKEFHNKVTMKNELILHTWSMFHFFTADSRELVTVFEFANWSNIEKAGIRDEELAKQAWPDSKQREAFMKKLDSYFTGHKDAIYNGMPSLTK